MGRESTIDACCDHCNQRFTAPAKAAGRPFQCTRCGASLRVPSAAAAVAPVADHDELDFAPIPELDETPPVVALTEKDFEPAAGAKPQESPIIGPQNLKPPDTLGDLLEDEMQVPVGQAPVASHNEGRTLPSPWETAAAAPKPVQPVRRVRVELPKTRTLVEAGLLLLALLALIFVCWAFIVQSPLRVPILLLMWLASLGMCFVGAIWILVIAFQEDAVCGVLMIFVPFYKLYYVFTRFHDVRTPLFMELGGTGMIVMIALFIPAIFGRRDDGSLSASGGPTSNNAVAAPPPVQFNMPQHTPYVPPPRPSGHVAPAPYVPPPVPQVQPTPAAPANPPQPAAAPHTPVSEAASDRKEDAAPPVLKLPDDPHQRIAALARYPRQQMAELIVEDAGLTDRFRWSKMLRRPMIGLRWGVGVIDVSDQPHARVDDSAALLQYTGVVGAELVAQLQRRVAEGKFGAWPADAGPYCEAVPLGLKSRADLISAARSMGLDLVLSVAVAKHRTATAPDTVLRVRILKVSDDQTLFSSETLSSARLALAQQRGNNLGAQFIGQVMAFVDANLLLEPMIVLKPEQAQGRAAKLAADPQADKLSALMEIRYYHGRKLLDDDQTRTHIDALLGKAAGATLLGDDAEAKQKLLAPLVDTAELETKSSP